MVSRQELLPIRLSLAAYSSALYAFIGDEKPREYDAFRLSINSLDLYSVHNQGVIRKAHESMSPNYMRLTPTLITSSLIEELVDDEAVSMAQSALTDGKIQEFIFWHDYSFGVNNVTGVLQKHIYLSEPDLSDAAAKHIVKRIRKLPKNVPKVEDTAVYLSIQDRMAHIKRLLEADVTGLSTVQDLHEKLLDDVYQPYPNGGFMIPQWVELGADTAVELYETLYPQVAEIINKLK